ncbi:MAG: hypothetical protein RLZZ618_2706 [Pseudomonadota bacterium]|jgi:hypothetical protein
MSDLTLSELQALCDFSAHEKLVTDALEQALQASASRVRFLGRYANWNGYFGSGVASLAGKIGRGRGLFADPEEPVQSFADRSVFVASFFFDAARDEFDDRDTVHRDTHRCLAQALLMGVARHEAATQPALADTAALNNLLAVPLWLTHLCLKVARGYGVGTPDDLAGAFHAIGYHLGSELLADREFSLIDQTLRAKAPELVDALKSGHVTVAGQDHVPYQWLAIHSGHGGGVEADHFEWAAQGVRLAYRFANPATHDAMRLQLHAGFKAFAADHHEFFTHVNADPLPL